MDIKSVEKIRINQLGYYPNSIKEFLLVDTEAEKFDLVDADNKVVFSGSLKENGTWDKSGEKVLIGDFSEFKDEGKFKISISSKLESEYFEIRANLYDEALKASIKSFYLQRASMAIEEKYAGIYKRNAGHSDDKCRFHQSSGKNDGLLNSPGGWYDAGDYGKYIVNGAFSVGQMLNLIEQYPDVIPDNYLNIPESGNGNSDLWDELMYELNWIKTMQDDDGGVYHKLTALHFSGMIMPDEFDLERRIIGKGTAATLNFAAVLAQASRLYKDIDESWSEEALSQAEKAWTWAKENDNIYFKNPKDVSTGEYGDKKFDDNFYWAASELFIASGKEEYKKAINDYKQEYSYGMGATWNNFIKNIAFFSLLENAEKIESKDYNELYEGQISMADELLNSIEKNPYNVALEDYTWGSNSDFLCQAQILCYAHRITKDEKYLRGAEQITDYIFGKNATGYCFLTGFGTKQVMNVHHRPSSADGIEKPVPGFIAGGPNSSKQDARLVDYNSDYPAKCFEDVEASYASNEVCINWNSPAVYVLAYINENRK